jgi:hypothetical protein
MNAGITLEQLCILARIISGKNKITSVTLASCMSHFSESCPFILFLLVGEHVLGDEGAQILSLAITRNGAVNVIDLSGTVTQSFLIIPFPFLIYFQVRR